RPLRRRRGSSVEGLRRHDAADRRRHRRLHRLGGHPPSARQHRRDGCPAASAGNGHAGRARRRAVDRRSRPVVARSNGMAREQVKAGTTSVWTDKTDRLLIVEPVFDAPRELVWKAWTDPEQLAKWWGPRGWTTTN